MVGRLVMRLAGTRVTYRLGRDGVKNTRLFSLLSAIMYFVRGNSLIMKMKGI